MPRLDNDQRNQDIGMLNAGMVRKRVIDVATLNVEGRLDSNGALRNVAVKDAWTRFRQKIEVKSWQEAASVLQELTDSLQKINLLKSVSGFINKLKTANPEEMVDDTDNLSQETPRGEKSRTLELANDLQKSLDEISKLEDCLRTVKQKVESSNDPPSVTPPNTYISSEMKNCYESLSHICEKYQKTTKELEQSKSRIQTLESKTKDMETRLEDKESQLNHLTAAVDTLEKKHSTMKEQKMDTFKDQMKVNSLERLVETKDAELKKLTEELSDQKQRFETLMKSKGGSTSDVMNPFPPAKIAEKYMEMFKSERAAAMNFYKTSEKKNDKDASTRVINMLQECYTFCETTSGRHLEVLTANILNPSLKETARSKETLEAVDMTSLMSIRRNTCKQSNEAVKNAFITYLEETSTEKFSLAEISGCLLFIEKCVDVCWASVLQSTPLWIGFDVKPALKTEVDTSVFDITEGKGKKVDLILWPPLYSEKGGTILRKGQMKVQ